MNEKRIRFDGSLSRNTGEKYFKLYFEPKKTEAETAATPAVEPVAVPLSESPDIPF